MGRNSFENQKYMRDFTVDTYNKLIKTLQQQGFKLSGYSEFHRNCEKTARIALRYDIDALKENSLQVAKIQHRMGITGSYYFRIVPQSFDQKIIEEIYSLGHEIGYHYEDVSLAARKRQASGVRLQEEELVRLAIKSFENNLEKLRKLVPVKTICMHGSPMNRWDSRLLWKYYDYHDFGIDAEPYFDINFENILYLTDTGRRWNGSSVNIRDKATGKRQGISGSKKLERGLDGEVTIPDKYSDWKVKPIQGSLMNMTQKSTDFQNKYKFRSTSDIIRATESGELPDMMMVTFHPQRWNDRSVLWVKELVWQNIKNLGKYFLIKVRRSGY